MNNPETQIPWRRKGKSPEDYEQDRVNKYAQYFQGNTVLPIPELTNQLETKTVSFIVTDLRLKRLDGLKKETFGELLRTSGVPCRCQEAEAAGCEGLVMEYEVHDALKQVGPNKLPGLDGLPYEVYLNVSHMFAPLLTYMFNRWFAQGAIPGSITKGVITLLKKGDRHVWEELDDYRPISLLSTVKVSSPSSKRADCCLSSVIWSDLSRTTLWREDQSKTTWTWSTGS